MDEKRNVQREYDAARTAVAIVEGTQRARLRVSGADAVSFLQNMLSHDVKRLQPGQGTHATFLTNKGKLVSDMRVFRRAQDFLLDMDASRVEPLQQALSRYVISEDVSLENWFNEESSFDVVGPRAAALLGHLTGEPLERFSELPVLGFKEQQVEGHEVRAIRTWHDPPRFQVSTDSANGTAMLERTLELAQPLSGQRAGPQVAEILRISAGEPRFGVDIDESHLPQEAGLEHALSFDKGCYIGQEYVVRLAHRGHVNRKLVRLEVEGAGSPSPGDAIRFEDKEVGKITSGAALPDMSGSVALATVKREAFDPGTQVIIITSSGEHPARVQQLTPQREGQ